MKLTVGKKIGIPLLGLLALVGTVALGVQVINNKVSDHATQVKDVAVPTAISYSFHAGSTEFHEFQRAGICQWRGRQANEF